MNWKYFLLILIVGCTSKNKTEKTSDFQILSGDAYGSTFSIVYDSEEDYSEEITSILNEFDDSVNTYKDDSFLSKFNRSKNGSNSDRMLREVLQISKELNIKTNGFFEPTVAPLMQIWGFYGKNKGSDLATKEEVDSVMNFVGIDKVFVKSDSIFKTDERLGLSFNAITGYINDKVASFLDSKNVENYLVEIGGEIIAKGKNNEGKLWRIGIDQPEEDLSKRELNAVVELNNKALATSGNYRKFHVDTKTGEKIVHTMNPKTGYPERSSLLSATVIASTCAEADATATALMAMGLGRAKEFIKQREDLKIYLIWNDDEKGIVNESFNGFVVEE